MAHSFPTHPAAPRRATARGRRGMLIAFGATALAAMLPPQAGAQAHASGWPNKPIRLVVAYAPGGTIDLAARRLAEDLSRELGQPVVVENRGGANGVPASEFVARSAPDGYTLLFTSLPAHAGNVSAYRKLPYDTVNDFIPVTVLAYQPLVLVAHPSVPANNIAELMKLARERPGQVSYASFGVGGLAHLAAVQLNQVAGTTMNHIPYKGGGPAMADVMGGHVNLYFSGVASTLPLLAEGKLKALGVGSAKRIKALPNVPTIAETPGFANFEAVVPPLMLLPARTPPEIVARLHAATYKVSHTKENIAKLEKAGEGDATAPTPQETMAMLKKDIDRLAGLFKAAGIEPE